MRRLPGSIALVSALTISAVGCGSAAGSNAASVGGIDYPEADLRADLADVTVDGTAPAEAATQQIQGWIVTTAVGLEMASRGVVVTDADRDSAVAGFQAADPEFDPQAPGQGQRVETRALQNVLLEWLSVQYPDAAPVDPDPGDPPDLLCANHIVVETEEEATDVLARLDDGEDFAALATELSIDPGSAEQGGALGCEVAGTFSPEFEAAAYEAEDGEIVGPVQTAYGYHVIQVLSAGPAVVEEHPEAGQEALDAAFESAAAAEQADAQGQVEEQRNLLWESVLDAVITNYGENVSVASEYGTWDPDAFVLVGPGQSTDAG